MKPSAITVEDTTLADYVTRAAAHRVSFTDIAETAVIWVKLWLDEFKKTCETACMEEARNKEPNGIPEFIVVVEFIFFLIFLASAILFVAGGSSNGLLYPGQRVSAVMMIFSAIVFGITSERSDQKRRKRLNAAKEQIMQERLAADPFYQRAKLIMDAVENFRAHCARYEAWYESVEQKLEAPNEEAADRYHAMLERALAVIRHAAKNFTDAENLAARREKFAKEHPVLNSAPESTALAHLLEVLDKPLEVPELPMTRPEATLEYEEALEELERDLDPERNLRVANG